jgi:hypothetical protein
MLVGGKRVAGGVGRRADTGKGLELMQRFCRVTLAAWAVLGFAATARAAAIDDVDPATMPAIDLMAPGGAYPLEVEMVVRNWVVCASAVSAEEIVGARVHGAAEARKAYAVLATAKSCGVFGELRVILQKPVYASSADAGYDARIFGALINFSGNWAAGFLVSGSLAD